MTDLADGIRIERVVSASAEAVWEMWTDPALFKQWYGPMGMSIPHAEMDLVVGGVRKIRMERVTPQATHRMWFTGVFKEITPPVRLVYTESLCDADGRLLPPQSMGMPDDHPDITEVTVVLRSEGGQTHMTLIHAGLPDGSPAASGWNQALDKLTGIVQA